MEGDFGYLEKLTQLTPSITQIHMKTLFLKDKIYSIKQKILLRF